MDNAKIASELVAVAKTLLAKETLDPKTRKAINKELANISSHNSATYYEHIPLDQTFDVLKKYGVIPLQEDKTHWSGFLTGKEGRANIHLARDIGKGPEHMHAEFSNAMLVMTWYKERDKYEYIVYVS